jgi:hypothetical protein
MLHTDEKGRMVRYMIYFHSSFILINFINLFDLLCLTPLPAIFQLYHGDQF